MAGKRQQMSSSVAGNATGSSSRAPRALGVSDAPAANQRISQADFLDGLDALVGKSVRQGGCSVGRFVVSLEEPLRSRMQEVLMNPKIQSARLCELLESYGVIIGSDVMRRHRRRIMGKDGCKCPRES